MAPLIRPFKGLRPVPEHAADVAAPPYDVLDTAEARVRAKDRPLSFLHISKPQIDLPEGTDPIAPEVYAKGAEHLQRMLDDGVRVRDTTACCYVYRLRGDGHEQKGLMFAALIEEYENNRIRRHEFTRPEKEDDRVAHLEALDAQTGPVFLTYPADAGLDELLDRIASGEPVSYTHLTLPTNREV